MTGLRLELFTGDVLGSVAFYRDVLGFEAMPTPRQSTYRPLRLGGVRISVQDVSTLSPSHPLAQPGARGLGVEIVLEVEDIQASHDRAKAAGARVTELTEQSWGLKDFRLSDPNGYYWRVTEARK